MNNCQQKTKRSWNRHHWRQHSNWLTFVELSESTLVPAGGVRRTHQLLRFLNQVNIVACNVRPATMRRWQYRSGL